MQLPIRETIVALIAVAGFSATPARANGRSVGDAGLFNRLDSNGDGVILADEVASTRERLFARLLRRADENRDGALAEDEFIASLVPSRPEKPIERKQPASFPAADAVRYLLLTLDTDINSVIEEDEVPDEMRPVFGSLVDRIDRDKSGTLEANELNRGGRPLAQIAARYVGSHQIDAAAELDKLKKVQGKSADRFDGGRPPVEMLADPRQARALFSRLDANKDSQIEPAEVPEPFQQQVERFLRVADHDKNGRLSKQEFLKGAKRISRFLSRQP